MMQKRLLSLLLITVAVLGIGLILTQRQQPVVEGQAESGELVPGLANALNNVSSIRITKAKNELVAELKRGEAGWTVANRHDYPADIGKVREYLIKLSESKVREAKTSKPENYSRLGVEDLGADAATGVGIELGGLPEPFKLVVGISSGGGSAGTFVRRNDDATSYLVTGDLIPEREGANWLAREIVNLPSSEVRSVSVTAPDKSSLKVEKADPSAPNFTVLGIPKGRELSSESVGNLIPGMLDGLTLEDILPTAEAQPDAATTWTASYTGYDGLAIDLTLWGSSDKAWARIAARVDDDALDGWVAAEKSRAEAERATAEAEVAAKAAGTEAKPTDAAAATTAGATADSTPAPAIPPPFDADKARAEKLADVQKRVDELNAKSSPWAYAIPTWKAANIKKKMDDMLKPKG
jgi:hypothetical protein